MNRRKQEMLYLSIEVSQAITTRENTQPRGKNFTIKIVNVTNIPKALIIMIFFSIYGPSQLSYPREILFPLRSLELLGIKSLKCLTFIAAF